MKTTPYTYLIGWSSLNKYYYGARYAQGCNPDDLWVTYFTSSKHVLAFTETHGAPDIIQIRRVFNEPILARLWESKVLDRINAAKNDKFINKRNGSWKWATCEMTESTRNKISKSLKGRTRSLEHRAALSKAKTGSKHTNDARQKISDAQTGKPRPDSFSNKMRSKIWINDGFNHARIDQDDPVPQGWMAGRIKHWRLPSPTIIAVNNTSNDTFILRRDDFCKMFNLKIANIPTIKPGKPVHYKEWTISFSTDAVLAPENPV